MKSLGIVCLALLAACARWGSEAPPQNLVMSRQSPELTLAIDRGFVPLPPLRFPIENLTDAERRIFVRANRQRVVGGLVIVQFERVQTGSDFRFLFPSKPPRQFGAQTYRFGTFVYDDVRAARLNPLKEAGKTRDFLAAAGYHPARFYRVARLARVTDSQGLSEVIIFYMESADERPPAGTPDEDGDWAVPAVEQAALAARMEAAIRVLKG